MTAEMMALRTLPEKSSDTDLPRELIGFTAELRNAYWAAAMKRIPRLSMSSAHMRLRD